MSSPSGTGPAAWQRPGQELSSGQAGTSMQSLQVARMSRALKALSDSNRIRILEILVTGEYCVSDLVERLKIDQPKVSHHLAILRSAGVIKSRRDGRHINYSLRPTVHHPVDGSEGAAHVFDLVDLCVTFRFPAAASAPGEAATHAETASAGPAVTEPRSGGSVSPATGSSHGTPSTIHGSAKGGTASGEGTGGREATQGS